MASAMKKYAALLAVPTVVGAGVFGGGTAAYAGPSSPPTTAAAWSCPAGAICFWDDFGGVGQRCYWYQADDDWLAGNLVCPWSDEKPVKSVFNNGRSPAYTGVAFYSSAGFVDRKGCTRQGQKGNLRGDYKVRSHRWIQSSCGS